MRTRRCKILTTLGPATDAPGQLTRMVETGVDAVRLNFSHGDAQDHRNRADLVRQAEAQSGRFIPIVADMQGPKLRVGAMPGGGCALSVGGRYRIVMAAESQDADVIPLPHPEILQALKPGDALLFDDGRLRASVLEADGQSALIQAGTPGTLTDKKGVSVPGRELPLSAVTDKDRADLETALSLGADYVALSFVQRAEDVAEAKAIIGKGARVLSKIEKPLALQHLSAIIEQSDAIMVARGDLGVELSFEQVPIAQRRIIEASRAAGKPVIVATHMLQSMVEEAAPTRAEATDIATAVYQGADAVMLSAETAVGRHPLTAVAVMDRVVQAIEADMATAPMPPAPGPLSEAKAVGRAVADLAQTLTADLAVAFSESGATGFALAEARPRCPLLLVTPHARAARAASLAWGVEARLGAEVADFDALVAQARAAALSALNQDTALIVLAAGLPIGLTGQTNLIHLVRATR